MNLPPDIRIKRIFANFGCVFYFPYPEFPEKAHPSVLVGMNVESGTILMVNGTSKVENAKALIKIRNLDKRTLVEANTKDCDALSKETAFNCNYVHEVDFQALITKIESNEVHTTGTMNPRIMAKIFSGIMISKLVIPQSKSFVKIYYRKNKH